MISFLYHYHNFSAPIGDMRLSWPQHLETARTLELTGDSERGEALALMGIALLMLAQDLLDQELTHGDGA